MVSFVDLAVHLVVWTPLLILAPGCVSISQIVKKKNLLKITEEGRKKLTHGFRTASAGR